jgi:ketosteroid isomerase-like protein
MRVTCCLTPLLLAVGALACGKSPQRDLATTRAALDSLLALHAEHAIAKNVEAMVNTYAADAVVRSNHMEPLRGRPALRAFFTNLFAAVDVRALKYTTEKLAVYGDSAWQVSTYELKVQPAGAPEQVDRGSAIVLWVRDSTGAWLIQDDVINSSLPIRPVPRAR